MSDAIELTGQKNLIKLKEQHTSYRELGRRTGKNSNYFSQIAIGKRKMSSTYAREVEKLLGLADGWMDISR